MKKIGILTYHRHNNYGAALQAYALQKRIQNMGYDVEILDYRYKDMRFSVSRLKSQGIVKYVMGLVGPITRIPRIRTFAHFRKKMKISSRYYEKDLGHISAKYDIFLTGSDNVWNAEITNFDKNYLLNFVSDDEKKRSYASSFGSNFIDDKLKKEYAKCLNKFSYLAVREESGAQIIKEITGKEAKVVLDPTFLLSQQEWEEIAEFEGEKEPYIFVYQMVPSTRFTKYVNGLKKKTGLKVIYITMPMGGFVAGKYKWSLGPEQWLGYIKNAEYVVTDSFHGTVFSIIFQKQFYVIVSQLATRIENILGKLGLEKQIVREGIVDGKVEYDEVLKKMDVLKKKSFEVLEECIR